MEVSSLLETYPLFPMIFLLFLLLSFSFLLTKYFFVFKYDPLFLFPFFFSSTRQISSTMTPWKWQKSLKSNPLLIFADLSRIFLIFLWIYSLNNTFRERKTALLPVSKFVTHFSPLSHALFVCLYQLNTASTQCMSRSKSAEKNCMIYRTAVWMKW